MLQADSLAQELVQKLPAAALAGLIGSLSLLPSDVAQAADTFTPPPTAETTVQSKQQQSMSFPSSSAPLVKEEYKLPEGNQWRYSEFINAVENGKVERVRFSKDGGQLQVIAFEVPSVATCSSQI